MKRLTSRRAVKVLVGAVAVGALFIGLGAASFSAVAESPPKGVSVTWSNTSEWKTGFQSDVSIRNDSAVKLNPWQIAFTYSHTVNALWNGTTTTIPQGFAVRAPTWAPTLASKTSTSFGLTSFIVGESPLLPSACAVVGLPSGSAPMPCSINGKNDPVSTPTPTSTPIAPATSSPTATPGPTPTSTPTVPPTSPGDPFVAPYVDMGSWPTPNLSEFAAASGVSALTGSFIVADRSISCSPTWAGYNEYTIGTDGDFQTNISDFQASGGEFVASFGGLINDELARVCTDAPALKAAYAAVIDRFSLTRVDFDIEGADAADSASNKRRVAVIAALQSERAAAGHPFDVTLTLPVMPDGLVSTGMRTVTEFAAAGVRLSAVNIMTMDYGTNTKDMGAAAISAAKATAAQLKSIPAYSKLSTAQRLSLIGITPMIGQNDTSEIFTIADAKKVGGFAKSQSVAALGWWEMTRDQPCTGDIPVYLCSGVDEKQWAFATAFAASMN